MERPGRISIVGILGIVLGCFGLMGAGQMAMLPNMVKMQKQMIADMQVQMKPEQRAQMEPFEHLMDGFWGELPPWYMSWAVTSGLILMAIKGFYIFAALSPLQLKRSAVRQFYWRRAVDCSGPEHAASWSSLVWRCNGHGQHDGRRAESGAAGGGDRRK